ncbi:MAG: chain-length determining protein [Deltaproteobacteria bacterium]|jgi:capsular polysaccharide transport system permease protein|nr:chain-length determining protein [Deltaproteobacteria bacterium]
MMMTVGKTGATRNASLPESGKFGNGAPRVRLAFRWLRRTLVASALLTMCYWLFASDRYVSEAVVLTQHTDKIGGPAFDISAFLGGAGGGPNRPDQLLLREHLLSVDMLQKLDAALDLRAHYSDTRRDIASRMWFRDASVEWFHRHYLSRTHADFDEFSGVLRIRAEAYDPQTARKIAGMLVAEGERYMNELSHSLARAQVAFLDTQVQAAYDMVLQASQILLDFQNQKGLASPQATVESIIAIIATLEGQRTQIQTQMEALPRTLTRDHSNIVMLRQALAAVERQITLERAKLASTAGNPLNSLVAEEQRLRLEVDFKKDVYKTALVALEKGRMDASRTIKLVSVLQAPILPEYPLEPRRIYGIATTLCIFLLIIGIVKLLEAVVLDHVD